MRRVLVVLPNWFGETLFATPLLKALRAGAPEAFIATLGVARCEEILANSPHVDEMIRYDERGAHRTWRAKRALIAALRAHRFDTAFILRRSASRTALLWAAGIRRRIGFASWRSGWLLTDRVAPPTEPALSLLARACRRPSGRRPAPLHKAQGYLALLRAAGLDAAPGPYDFYPTAAEHREAAALLAGEGIGDGQRLIVLHPGANWPHKRWPARRFAELADRLARPGRVIALTGAGDDGPLVDAVRAQMASLPVMLAGKTTLRQMAACLTRAALVVSNDTGVMHLAAALGRPVVALYGPTSPQFTGPFGDPTVTRVLHHAACCPAIPCYRPEHPGYPGMEAIAVDEVLAAAEALLAGGRP